MLGIKRTGWRAAGVALTLAIIGSACGADNGNGEADDLPADTETDEPADEEPEEAAEYDGDDLTLVIAFGAGGGYDTIGRVLADYVGEELGVNVVVENQPGAGGLLATNNLFTDRGDHTRVLYTSGTGVALSVVGDAEGVGYDISEFNFVGRTSADQRILVSGATSPVQSLEDLTQESDVRFVASGPGGASAIEGEVLYAVLDIDGDLVYGIDDGSERQLSVTRGETDLVSGPFGTFIQPVQEGDHTLLAVLDREPLDAEGFEDTPTIYEAEGLDEDGAAILDAKFASDAIGRTLIAPPDVDETQLQIVRDAFNAALNNPDFQADLAEVSEETIEPLTGEEVEGLVDEVLDSPPALVEILQAAYAAAD